MALPDTMAIEKYINNESIKFTLYLKLVEYSKRQSD